MSLSVVLYSGMVSMSNTVTAGGTSGNINGSVSSSVLVVTTERVCETSSDVMSAPAESMEVGGGGKLRVKDISKQYLKQYDRYEWGN